MGKESLPPDELRCRRTDGRDWRCVRRCMEGRTQCEVHYLQSLYRQQRQRVPDTLKLKRRPKSATKKDEGRNRRALPSPSPPPAERITEERYVCRAKERRSLAAKSRLRGKRVKKSAIEAGLRETLGRALSLSLKKMKMKKRDLKGELVRIVVSRELERRAKSESLVRDFPNGVMLVPGSEGCIGDPFQGRAGSSGFLAERRPIRSKNAEVAVFGTFKAKPGNFPFGAHRKHCHQCRRSDREMMIRCSSCHMKQFCQCL